MNEISLGLRRCSHCVLPETHETIAFDSTGTCNICRQFAGKADIDWETRRKELDDISNRYRGRGTYDAIIPLSGGKDSSYVVWFAVRQLHLRPLVVRFNHGFLRPNVLANTVRTLGKLGCDILDYTPSWPVVRRLMLQSLLVKGDACWFCHVGVFSLPMRIALLYRVPLIIWGEHSSEYTAYYATNDEEEVDERRFNRFVNLGISADDMLVRLRGLAAKRDLDFARYPTVSALKRLGVRSICLGSYVRWDTRRHVDTIRAELGWQGDEVEGVASDRWPYEKVECAMQGPRDFLKFLKRGYARTSHLASIDIRNGRLTRDEGLRLVELYEGKRPASLDIFLSYIGLTEEEFRQVALSHTISPYRHDFAGEQHGAPVHDMTQWQRKEPMPRAEATTLLAHWQRRVGGE